MLQQIGHRTDMGHRRIEPEVVAVWIKDYWHPVVDYYGHVGNQRAILITLTTDDTVYNLVMRYSIGKDEKGTILACLACIHTERVQDFKENIGNPRTLAAQAMLKHVDAKHSRETHVRVMAMVMERQHAPR